MTWTIKGHLSAMLLALIGGLWAIGSVSAAWQTRHDINELFDSVLQETAEHLLPLVSTHLTERNELPGTATLPDAARRLGGHEQYITYQVRDTLGRIVMLSPSAPSNPSTAPLKAGKYWDGKRRYFTVASPDGTLFLQVAENPEERDEAIFALWVSLLVPMLILIPVAGYMVILTVRRATNPIGLLQQQLSTRDGDHLQALDSSELPGELKPIIFDVNRLLERLKFALEAERSFTANSAHELRNPIAAACAQAEVLRHSVTGADKNRAESLIALLGQLSRRLERVLQLSRADAGLGLSREETDLVAITRMITTDYMHKRDVGPRLLLAINGPESIAVAVDPDAIGIALQNLLDNAFAHGRSGGKVSVTVGPAASVEVSSEGPPVPAADLERITGRFARGPQRATHGSGLGLSIVNEIMRQSGGEMVLRSPARDRTDGFDAVLNFKKRDGDSRSNGSSA